MQENIRYSVGILAGGKSRRMGENKAFLTLNGKPFVTGMVEEFDGLDVMVSVAFDAKLSEWESYVDHETTLQNSCYVDRTRLFPDTREDAGPLEGMYQLLTHAKENYVFICAVDMPFFKRDMADYLASQVGDDADCVCLRDEAHVHPTCAIYSVRAAEKLKELLLSDHHRVSDFLDAIRTKYVFAKDSGLSDQMLRNINTKEEYHEAVGKTDS